MLNVSVKVSISVLLTGMFTCSFTSSMLGYFVMNCKTGAIRDMTM
jgi:hypothetical protein